MRKIYKLLAYSSFFLFLANASSAQSLLINEVCSKNKTLISDPDGDYPDWIELYNAGPIALNLANYGLSDDPLAPGKWKFPSYTINPGEYLTIFASDKNKSTPIDHWETVAFDSSYWKYTVPVSNISNWPSPSFSDAGWATGRGGIGHGDGDDSIVVPASSKSIYMRKSFNITDTSRISAVALNLDYEDGFVAYLNGVEVARFNLEGTPPKYDKPANADRSPFIVNGLTPEEFLVSSDKFKSLLKNGTNVFAIEVHAFFRTWPEGGNGYKTARPFLMLGFKDQVQTFYDNPGWFSPVNQHPLVMHTSYKLSGTGETLILTDLNNTVLDNISFPALEIDHSYGRTTDGSGSWGIFNKPTPGSSNSVSTAYSGYWKDSISFSHAPGFYTSAISLLLSAGNAESEIRYTTDGSTPKASSSLYTGPVQISSSKVIKAGAFKEGFLTSSFETNTFLINENIKLPVISISAEPNDFFGSDGLYTQYEQDYERKAHIEYFETDKDNKFEQDLGVKIHGAVSRMHPMKSLRFIPREDYGDNKIRYKLFSEKDIHEFDQIILRNSGNDFGYSNIRDALNHRVLQNKTEVDFQAYQPVVVFINGAYWGIHNMRERIGAGYIKENHGYSKSQIDLLEKGGYIIEGSNTAFSDLLANSYNISYLENNLDLQNFVDYMTSQIYHVNNDWPHNNVKYWRPHNGKWRYLYYDTDFSLSLFNDLRTASNVDELSRVLSATNNPHSELLRNALYDGSFENYFINRYADLMNTIYKPENYLQVMDEILDGVASDVARHKSKWGGYSTSDFDYIRNFINARPSYARSHVVSRFGLSGEIALTLNVQGEGKIKISTIAPDTYPWSGIYFSGNSVPLEAVPADGYEFSHWTFESTSSLNVTNRITSHNFTSATTITAHFTATSAYGKLAVSEINYNSDTTNNNSGDWIELHNYGNASLDISGWWIKDGIHYNKFTIPTRILQPGEYLVICSDTNLFKQQHPPVTNFIGNLGFKLDNAGEQISIFNQIGDLKIQFIYNDKGEWPILADGYGATLENVSPESDPANPSSWFSGCKGGSPGSAYDPCYCSKPDFGQDRLLCHTDGVATLSTGIPAGTNRIFRWYYNGMELTGLNIPELSVTAAGEYRVIYDSLQCLKTDKVLVEETLQADLPASLDLCNPSYTTLSTGRNFENTVFEWKKDGAVISEHYEILVKTPGEYILQASSPGCAILHHTVTITTSTAIPQDDHVCNEGSGSLSVTGTGKYKWFDSETGGSVVATGLSFTTPYLNATKTYYVEDTTHTYQKVGIAEISDDYTGSPSNVDYRMKFTVYRDLHLKSILVYAAYCNKIVIRILNQEQNAVFTKEFPVTSTSSASPIRLDLDVHLSPANFVIDAVGTNGYLNMETYIGSFPYTIPEVISLTGNTSTFSGYANRYPFFYDWEVGIQANICNPVPVTAYVDDCGPVNSNYSGTIANELSIVPNPSSNGFSVMLQNSNKEFFYTITDLNGVLRAKGYSSSSEQLGAELLTGIYFIRVQLGDTIFTGKIIKTE